MSFDLLLSAALVSATPILFAALGELVTERAGILNLGIEGTMLVGAVSGFTAALATGSPVLGLVAALIAGALVGCAFAFGVVTLRLDQVVAGLAFTVLGTGLSAFVGQAFVGQALTARLPAPDLGPLTRIPLVGPIFFAQDPMVIAAFLAVPLVWLYLHRTRPGLVLRTLGESPQAIDALGMPVPTLRYAYTMAGSALIALGGAYLSVVYTPSWVENMTAGRGWIALGLVIFAGWRPGWLAVGAVLFGMIDAYRFRAQIGGQPILDPHFLNMLPYVATLLVLGLMNRPSLRRRVGPPAALGLPYDRERR